MADYTHSPSQGENSFAPTAGLPPPMMPHQPAETLKNRSFIGLILSQFLAAFNDQATHIVAIFFAGDMLVHYAHLRLPWLDRNLENKDVILTVTFCFIAPFLLFSPIAGPLADRYSKRSILVFWKVAEIAMMGLVLTGFILPHCVGLAGLTAPTIATISAILVVLGVFLMGTHSAFFVPAKYGAMPEILHHSILSRGNGLLEGTSFTANILGTVFGGFMYGLLKCNRDENGIILGSGSEWIIGVVLLTLAVIGAIGSLMIERLPPASPDKRHSFLENFRVLGRSRSLMVAVAGIAFFAFMTLFMRQVLLLDGEAEKDRIHFMSAETKSAPPEEEPDAITQLAAGGHHHLSPEMKVAYLIALVGLGVGIGCMLAGYLSGRKLELGLVLIGAFLLVVTTAGLAFAIRNTGSMIFCLILIGAAAGLYIVPMYTMLQHRAPKGSKGNLVAMSNFVNVAGGLLSLVVFFGMTTVLERVFDLNIHAADVAQNPALRDAYIKQLEKAPTVAGIEFFGGSVITLAMILLLVKVRPDFLVRTLFWTRTFSRTQVNPDGLHHMPEFGSLLLVTQGATADDCLQLASLTDRFARFLVWDGLSRGHKSPEFAEGDPQLAVVRRLARRAGILFMRSDYPASPSPQALLDLAVRTLRAGHVFAIGIPDGPDGEAAWEFIAEVQRLEPTPVCPVLCRHESNGSATPASSRLRLQSIVTGNLLKAGSANGEIQTALAEIARTVATSQPGEPIA